MIGMRAPRNDAGLFDDAPGEVAVAGLSRYVCVFRDGVIYEGNPYALFDGDEFDQMFAVTYVSSPKSFVKVAHRFDRVEFILGTPDSSFSTGVDALIKTVNPENAIAFWNGLTRSLQEKVAQGKVKVRYPQANVAIHSKIYMLKKSTTKASRLMIGSANLTDTAFTERPQFEELLVYDNSPLFDLYMERFRAIYRHTADYIPEGCVQKRGKDQVIVADEDTVVSAINEVLGKQKTATVAVEDINMLERLAHKDLPRQIEEVKRTINIVRLGLSGQSATLSPTVIAQNLPKVRMIVSTRNPTTTEIDVRSRFVYDDSEKTVLMQIPAEEGKQALAHSLAKEAPLEQLRSSLECINAFVDAYRLFTMNPDVANQSRVMEAILYAFMGPYLWKARSDLAREQGLSGMRALIPPFLIVGGRARSGKTTLLEFINRLLGGGGKPYFGYQAVEKSLVDLIKTENLYPVLVDEIPQSFFRSTAHNKGDQIIKYMANELEGKHPVVIATTNHSEFSIGDQALRRIYYLTIDNTFDKGRFVDSAKHLETTLMKADSSLFCDFTYRMQALLGRQESFADPMDPLRIAREVFQGYYRSVGINLPNWFPMGRFDDYEERGRKMWQGIYQSYGQDFRRGDANTLSVEYKNMGWDERQKDSCINYLPPYVVIENKGVLILRAKEFFEWLRVGRRRPRFAWLLRLLKVE